VLSRVLVGHRFSLGVCVRAGALGAAAAPNAAERRRILGCLS
jgi:hypothetical protein